MMRARGMLLRMAKTNVDGPDPVYTERDDPAIGKNTLCEADRLLGVYAYTSALKKYALEDH